jgi:hypothetical protein
MTRNQPVLITAIDSQLLYAPVEFDALPQDRHLTFAAHCLVLDIARNVARRAWAKRFDGDAVQDGPYRGAPAVRGPRFPCVTDPSRAAISTPRRR